MPAETLLRLAVHEIGTHVFRWENARQEIRSAFDIAVRVKRGLVDTAAPGGFIKDHVYLGGLRGVERYLDAAPGDYDLLMSGKWPLRRQELLKAAGAPWPTQRPLRIADENFVAGIRSSIAESDS